MAATYNLKTIKLAVKLLKEYEAQQLLCATEFINAKNASNIPEETTQIYLMLIKHQNFLEELLDIIWRTHRLKRMNKWATNCLILLVIFVLSESNYHDILTIFNGMKYKFTQKLLEFFLSEENLAMVAQVGCKYFDSDYVLQNVIYPLLHKRNSLLKDLYNDLLGYANCQVISKPAKSTKHFPFHKVVYTEPEIPKIKSFFKARELPNTTYHTDKKVLRNLTRSTEENWSKAIKLHDEANENPFRCAVFELKSIAEEKLEKTVIKATKAPKFTDNVEIKKTTATVMREAALLVKDRENELKKLEELLSGAFDQTNIEKIDMEIRKKSEQQKVQEIEKKHLLGQLTFEDAVLAKKKLTKDNKLKMEKFKEDRVKLMEEFFDWKQKEEEKIKSLVEKGHGIDRSVKLAEKRLLKEKQMRAKLIGDESKKLLRETYLKGEEELSEKVRLIREFRVLQRVRLASNVKEFDPTECPNFGLFCEMSVAELRERLTLLKITMREELEERRRNICEERRRKELLVDGAKEFVSQARMSKPKPMPSAPPNVEQTPDIIALREKLRQARRMRLNTTV